MSWWFRKPMSMRRHRHMLLGSMLGILSAPGFAAQIYVQPAASITAEENTNIDLEQGPNPNTAGYIGDLSTLIGIATPNAYTTIRPHVDYRDYPTDSSDNRLEEYLDLDSGYKTLRSKADVYFNFERRDDFGAEQSAALYNDIGPTSPTSPETGRSIIGATRTSVLLLPDYSYSLTPRIATGISAIYQEFEYSPENSADAIDFHYYQAKPYTRFTLDPKNDLTVGVYGSKYEASHFESAATSGGASLQLDTLWSPLLSTSATAVYQRTNIDTSIPVPFKQTSNPWGLSVSGAYKTEIQQFRLDAGRVITPSGGGGIYVNEQVQFQYNRNFSRRMTFTGATIALRNHALTSYVSGDDRTYVRTVLDLKWMVSRTLYLQGGYQYMWQKYQAESFSADNNRVYIRFGYQGLGRQW